MLIKLFSETSLFAKPFIFRNGLNFILGKYSGDKNQTGINGIGKSSLIRLIDYTLLSSSAESLFHQPKYDFLREEGHSIILEFKTDKNYFIKRTFYKNDKILFGSDFNALEEYSKSELKNILTNKLFPINNAEIVFNGDRFGTLMDFFIKDDLEHQRRTDPLNFSSGTSRQSQQAIFNFFLLGLPTKDILNFEDLSKEYDRFASTVGGLEDKIRIDYNKSVEELRSESIVVQERIRALEANLSEFKFLDIYKNIEEELVNVTSQINEKLKEYHSLNRKLKKIKESFQFEPAIDAKKVSDLYNDAISTLGDVVSRTLQEVIDFRHDILENRGKFLIAREKDFQKSIDRILGEISELENLRSDLYKKLSEKGAIESITNAFEQLTIERSKQSLNASMLKQIDELQDMMANLSVSISEVKRDIISGLNGYEGVIQDLRALFLEILKNAIVIDDQNAEGFFDIRKKPDTSRIQLPFKIEVNIPKADALGQSRLKIVAYDLMVFLNSIKKDLDLPKFLIHDGVYHGISLSTRVKALNYIYHQNLKFPNFQYIVSFNEDEILISDAIKKFVSNLEFEIDDFVLARFTDKPEEMLFMRNFK